MWQISDSKMWSLGTFKPRLTCESGVQEAFVRFLKRRVTTYQRVDVRTPGHRFALANWGPQPWHRDTDYCIDVCYLAVWSNMNPTEVRYPRQKEVVYQADPFEVLLFDNRYFTHRPPNCPLRSVRDRWFARAQVGSWPIEGSVCVKDVPGVYSLQLPND